MKDWNLSLVKYWDQLKKAIFNNTKQLDKLSESKQKKAYDQIREAVNSQVQAYTDEQLLMAAVSLVDDLYKFLNDEVFVATTLFEYLEAFGRTFTDALRERGYVINYIVDNQFTRNDVLFQGAFDLFKKVFNAAGLVYICPQLIGMQLMQADGINDDFLTSMPRYINEARYLSDKLVTECHEEGLHYVFLETNFEDGVLDAAVKDMNKPGVLGIFRNEAPIAGSKIQVSYPDQQQNRK
jgi:hypothetical protein